MHISMNYNFIIYIYICIYLLVLTCLKSEKKFWVVFDRSPNADQSDNFLTWAFFRLLLTQPFEAVPTRLLVVCHGSGGVLVIPN